MEGKDGRRGSMKIAAICGGGSAGIKGARQAQIKAAAVGTSDK